VTKMVDGREIVSNDFFRHSNPQMRVLKSHFHMIGLPRADQGTRLNGDGPVQL
jgi:hypothetical protein